MPKGEKNRKPASTMSLIGAYVKADPYKTEGMKRKTKIRKELIKRAKKKKKEIFGD